ncbi:MAG: phosphoribosyltransferase, partial [Brachybacterium sp.]|nr:phosphoribosyltransferase [Brachybacterium sp.]
MVFLAHQLDDDTARPCGRCDVCAGPWYPAADGFEGVDGEDGSTGDVAALLDRVGVPIEPRRQWPSGLNRVRGDFGGAPPAGKIADRDRAETGRVIARRSDLGWGSRLREVLATDAEGRRVDAEVPADLGKRVVEVLTRWDWEQRPAAVVAVPSVTRPQLVASLAAGIAQVGRLENLGTLDLAPGAGPLRSGGNSAYRVAELWTRFAVGPQLQERLDALGGAPVLLVDDEIDSRWTMTIAARLLRRAGAGPVLPLALALAA